MVIKGLVNAGENKSPTQRPRSIDTLQVSGRTLYRHIAALARRQKLWEINNEPNTPEKSGLRHPDWYRILHISGLSLFRHRGVRAESPLSTEPLGFLYQQQA
ncbi:hypothetical protein PoB_002424800 [Plakobranchus ocellatus]|uniref:Uncharacterized protein n=1 Tax=Plakobranchus ocellatus TaxID=259542 RepID=A0AAV3ZSB4_9GAST|nr:hypothetical protein PoB_002424800 [Plakobranchus ocellatus]